MVACGDRQSAANFGHSELKFADGCLIIQPTPKVEIAIRRECAYRRFIFFGGEGMISDFNFNLNFSSSGRARRGNKYCVPGIPSIPEVSILSGGSA